MISKKVYGGDVFYILECSIFFVESLHWFENREFLFINPVEAQDFVIAGREKEYSLYLAKDTFQTNPTWLLSIHSSGKQLPPRYIFP